MSKWTDSEVQTITEAANAESPVSLETVANLAEQLERSTASVASKLRHEGHEVQRKGDRGPAFSDEQAQELQSFVENHSGEYTYQELADQLFNGGFSSRQIQGKCLALELTSHVKRTPPRETVKSYSDEDEATVVQMAQNGSFLEDIAEAVGREVNSVRGKALSLLRAGQIEALPVQRDHKPRQEDAIAALGDDIAGMTVSEIAEATGKTERGIKSALTHRGINVQDYNGADRRAKRDAQAA